MGQPLPHLMSLKTLSSGTGGGRALVWLPLLFTAVTQLSNVIGAQTVTSTPRGTPAQWRLLATPTLVLAGEGDSATEFLRIVGVTRTPAGDIVVANGSTQELRLFRSDGRYVRRLSRAGDGPGELRTLSAVSRAGDRLYVLERHQGPDRLSTFATRSGFVERELLHGQNTPTGVTALDRLTSGEILVSEGDFRRMDPPAQRTWRDSVRLGILHRTNNGRVTWLGTFPFNTWYSYSPPSFPGRLWVARYTLGAELVYGVSGDRIWIGDSGTGAIQILDARGRRVASMERPVARREFDRAALDRERRRLVASARNPDERARHESLYDREARPRYVPAFRRFVRGVNGEMGVELFGEERGESGTLFVFNRSGNLISRLAIPPGVTFHELGLDFALGVHHDDDGLETVVMYRLERR